MVGSNLIGCKGGINYITPTMDKKVYSLKKS